MLLKNFPGKQQNDPHNNKLTHTVTDSLAHEKRMQMLIDDQEEASLCSWTFAHMGTTFTHSVTHSWTTTGTHGPTTQAHEQTETEDESEHTEPLEESWILAWIVAVVVVPCWNSSIVAPWNSISLSPKEYLLPSSESVSQPASQAKPQRRVLLLLFSFLPQGPTESLRLCVWRIFVYIFAPSNHCTACDWRNEKQ